MRVTQMEVVSWSLLIQLSVGWPDGSYVYEELPEWRLWVSHHSFSWVSVGWMGVTFMRNYPDRGSESVTACWLCQLSKQELPLWEVTRMWIVGRLLLVRLSVNQLVKSYLCEELPDGDSESLPLVWLGVGQSDRSYLYEKLSGVGVILDGVSFVRNYLDGSYPYGDDETTISSVGYEPTK